MLYWENGKETGNDLGDVVEPTGTPRPILPPIISHSISAPPAKIHNISPHRSYCNMLYSAGLTGTNVEPDKGLFVRHYPCGGSFGFHVWFGEGDPNQKRHGCV